MRISAAALMTSLLIIAAPAVQADQSADREAINELMWRYARALDTMNAEAYVAVYTPDGEFKSGGNATQGSVALKAMIDGLKEGRERRAASGEIVPALYHMTTDAWIEFIDETHARHHSYWLTVFGSAGPGTTPNVAAAGRGVDELVKVDGKWLIKSRDVAPKD